MNETPTPWARANAILERAARNEESQKLVADARVLSDLRAEVSELCEIATPPDDLLRRAKELGAVSAMIRELNDYAKNAADGSRVMLCGAQQQSTGSGKFLVSEATSENGWSWPVQVIRSGLLKSATDIRSMVMAAQEAGRLDLFGVSIFAYFGFRESRIEGKPALVATTLHRFVGLDLCAEPGAGGRFMPTASQN